MKVTNRIIALTLVIISLFSLISCSGEFEYGNMPGGNNNTSGSGETVDSTTVDSGTEGGYVPPEMNDDPTDDFVVTVKVGENNYKPRTELYARWSDGNSVHRARVDESGVARIDGLDGDYRVTLDGVPNEFTYDPNSSYATNDNRSIAVNLYPLNFLAGTGSGIYDCQSFRETGVYCAVIDGPEDAIYFEYAPSGSGTYSIESWMDVTADNVNPYVDVYYGNSQWKKYDKTIDDGGAVGSYTINFVHSVSIAKENISGGGQATYTFAIKAESKNNKYPIVVTFAVKRNGEFELQRPGGATGTSTTMAIPEHDFSTFNKDDHTYGSKYRLKYPEYTMDNGTRVFDEKLFKIWKKKDGGDDFYHVYDPEKYPETNGYGPVLYARITAATRFVDTAFTRVEYFNGEVINSALSVGGKNYKHFIEGYTQLATMGNINKSTYYCVEECQCHDSDESLQGWACPTTTDANGKTVKCPNCHEECRGIPPELVGFEGYQAYANSDGYAPVTEELKEFLLAFANKQTFFFDGLGELEQKGYQAVGNSGWLFACAYYEERN